jgi:predicted Zn finger-like uncharacterized protein
MVIECTECHTRFKLADDKVKPGGTKVRCSKCKHIFTVMPPAPTPPQEEEIDFGGFNMERLPEPGTEQAVTPPAEFSASTAGGEDSAAIATAPPLADQSRSEESVTAGDEGTRQTDEFTFGTAAESDASERSSGQWTEEDIPFDDEQTTAEDDQFTFGDEAEKLSDEPANDLKTEDTFSFGDEEAESDEFTFGEADKEQPESDNFSLEGSEDFPFGEDQDTGEEDSAPEEFSFETAATTGSVEFDFDEGEPGSETGAAFSWEAEKDEISDEGFDFDESAKPSTEIDEFDFSGITFGEEEPPQALSVAEEERPAQVQAQPDVISVDAPPHHRELAAERTPPVGMPEPGKMPLPITPRRKSPIQGVMLIIGLLLLAMIGGAIYFYWQGGIPELTNLVDRLTGQTAAPQVKGQIRLEGLSSFYVKNGEVGQILVIQGQAVNDFPEARSSLAVKGVLFNKEGKALLQQTVFCGNPLTQDALMKLPYAKIEESMNNPFGESLSNLNVGPGKALPFTIVFRNLPADIAEFTIEAVDSKPASKQ